MMRIAKGTIPAATLLALAAPAHAQDSRPLLAYAALPPVGTTVPAFAFPLLGGDTVSTASLRGSPAVLALWATWCSGARAVLGDIETLAVKYQPQGVRVAILADDDPADLQAYFSQHPVHALVAQANHGLKPVFDRSATASERESHRVEWALPLWLVIDANGVVALREGGPAAVAQIGAVLDSLLARH